MNSTFEIGLQNVVINGGVLLGLGGHEGLSDFPESLTFPSCCGCPQADGLCWAGGVFVVFGLSCGEPHDP